MSEDSGNENSLLGSATGRITESAIGKGAQGASNVAIEPTSGPAGTSGASDSASE